MNDLISIIVHVNNKSEFLQECLDSIIRQTYKFLEIIIVDDGSFDGTATICDKYANLDKRIKVVHEPQMSMVAIKNIGLSVANGKYITFVNGGDYIDENYVERLYTALCEHEVDIAFCRYKKYFVSHNEKVLEDNLQNSRNFLLNFDDFVSKAFLSDSIGNNIKCHIWRTLFITKIIRSNNISFDENVSMWEDAKFLFTYLKYCNSYYVVDNYLYYLRQDEDAREKYEENYIDTRLDACHKIISYVKDENIKTGIRFSTISHLFHNELSNISTYYDNDKVKRIFNLPEYESFTFNNYFKYSKYKSFKNLVYLCCIKLRLTKFVWKLNRNKD